MHLMLLNKDTLTNVILKDRIMSSFGADFDHIHSTSRQRAELERRRGLSSFFVSSVLYLTKIPFRNQNKQTWNFWEFCGLVNECQII